MSSKLAPAMAAMSMAMWWQSFTLLMPSATWPTCSAAATTSAAVGALWLSLLRGIIPEGKSIALGTVVMFSCCAAIQLPATSEVHFTVRKMLGVMLLPTLIVKSLRWALSMLVHGSHVLSSLALNSTPLWATVVTLLWNGS
jgi:hypothetical protein